MSDRLSRGFVHAVTAALAVAGGWYVSTQGSPLPIMDEWDLLANTRDGHLTFGWMIQHHGEHRFPLPKLLWLTALRATGYDFRAVMFVTLTLLVAASILLMWTARGLRGRQHPADALVPALLLHWGHGFNLIMSFQLGFALVAYALAGWLWCAGRAAAGSRLWLFGAVGYALVVIPCGGFGVTFAPAVVGWCAWAARREWRAGRVATGAVPFLAGVAAAAHTAWVAATMPTGLNPTTSPVADPLAFGAAFVGSLSVAVGTWPAEVPVARWLVGIAVVALYAAAAVRGCRKVRANPTPLRAALLAVVGGTLTTAAATAYARGGGYAERMADASAVGLVAAWLTLFGGWIGGRWVSAVAVLAAAGGLFWANWTPGLDHAIQTRHQTWHLRNDLLAGVPPAVLASRHGHSGAVVVGEILSRHVVTLRDMGLPDFRAVPDDPPATAIPVVGLTLPLRVASPDDTPLDGLAVPATAVALRFRAHTPADMVRDRVTLLWTDAASGRGHETEARPRPNVGDSYLLYPVHGKPTGLRLRPDAGITELRLLSAEWLMPVGGSR